MKKLILICAVVFVSFTSTQFAVAQATFEGHGSSIIEAQRETDVAVMEENGYKAIFDESALIIRNDLQYVNASQIREATYNNITKQMGEPFDPTHPQDYKVTYTLVGPGIDMDAWNKFCQDYEDGYIIDQPGRVCFHYGNPAKSYASEHKSVRVVMTITKISDGASAKLMADCINVLRKKVTEYAAQDAPVQRYVSPAGSTINIYNRNVIESPRPQSLVYRQPASPIYQHIAENNCHTLRTVVIVSGVVLITAIIIYELTKPKHPAVVDTNHSNSWDQDSGGSPYAPGSGSTVPNGPTF